MLAGGRSSRFGSDKALFEVDGLPLVARVAEVLRLAGLDPVVVVGKSPRGLGIFELMEPEGCWHPLHGVATALGALGAQLPDDDAAFFSPCDLIDLDTSQVETLVRQRAIARGQPLCGVIPRRLRDEARRLAEVGAPVRRLMVGLPELDVGPLGNLNRPPAARSV